MDWFRLYSEFATDPKVQMMPEAMQRRLIMLFCLQCSNGIETFHETERETSIAFSMRISESELAETKDMFLRKGFINPDWTLRNWNKRQYVSDSSTARVRKHRAARKEQETKGETDMKRSSNAPEQNRTDKNKEKALSGRPDVETHDTETGLDSICDDAVQAIEYLNAKAGRSFRPVPVNVGMVKARLREGFSLDDVKAVIDAQVSRWRSDPKMEKYLRPATLFGREKFANYSGQTQRAIDWWTSAGFGSQFDAENAGCNQWIASQWRDGRRIEVSA